MNDRDTLRAGALLLAGLLAGCAVGPNYHRPATAAPERWEAQGGTGGAGAGATAAATARWWEQFNDAELSSLVVRGLEGNLDVQGAEARLRQARAARGVAVGGFWPFLTASGQAQRGASPGVPTANTFQAGLDAAWEIDVFGGTRRSVEAAGAAVEAAQADLGNVRVSLAAEVALDYLQVRSAQEQIAIARQNLSAQRHTAGLIHQRLKVGFSSGLDAANADAQVATTAASIPPLETQLRQSIHALGVLLGRAPEDLAGELLSPGALPPQPPPVAPGIPSDVLRRRPDIASAEAQLHAATAEIGVAVADFFPKFPLTASLGYQSAALRSLFESGNRTWAAGPTVNWPFFQGGAIAANVRVQRALRDQAYLTYRKTVLTAFQEVDDALVALANEQAHREALAEAEKQDQRALDLSTRLYTQGAADFLSVLDAERSLYSSQTALAQSRQSAADDVVALYKALGGGWEP